MEKRNIIVIGASMGGFDALRKMFAELPADLDAAIFIVWHMSPFVRGVLPQTLNKLCGIPAAHAFDGEPIAMNRIYVAPPDHHMILEDGMIRVTHGPKENRFRPAVDPLFRSAAYIYGNRVIGVILSGALDDGTAGLWTVKYLGGLALVQNPLDAEVASMPESAIRQVKTDYIVPLAETAQLLVRLASEQVGEKKPAAMKEKEKTKAEIRMVTEVNPVGVDIKKFGQLSPYACPECHGVLTLIKEGDITRFRCHTGHAYSSGSLLSSLTERMEEDIYGTLRGLDETIMLLNQLGDHFAEANHARLAAVYFRQAAHTAERAALIRQAAMLPATFEPIQQENQEQLPG
ncbi:chemotaxis protein CheB [Dyadobacter fermentans]|uniref:protein-glutamate methylesterase n=1 Tax=Dyadobacter fermentans (strain ATCC 700827 / DSM 18053 / CIP 107007 / KCTC 52180 / NS114) TaxID=471854 RepID=C6VSE1_DYAFD|nr:chemotaxis protein CheB [Dyadobacter fermentans]ACT96376.1 CheB methylesterase [Dyadobacter fermentans DSM 18053]